MSTSAPSSMSDRALRSLEPSAVIFDLDGTISDSGPVITRSIAEALAEFGYPVPPPTELLRYVGPPIRTGFATFAQVPPEQVGAVVADYRARYDDRMLEAPVFAGMAKLVAGLHDRGVPIALATSKRQSIARVVLEHAGLSRYFTSIRGASEDETRAIKAHIVADALDGLRRAGADVDRAVMVGDRHHDVEGATSHDLAVVHVTWGYAFPGEDEGATAVATTVAELAALLA